MLFKWRNKLLIQGVLVEFIEHDLRNLWFFYRVLSQVNLQMVELVAVAFDQDQVESFVDQKMCERFSDLCAGSIYYSCVL